jgi:uridine kinase
MIGDRIIPKAHHTSAAEQLHAILKKTLRGDRPVITIGGESGSGKSEIAFELSRLYDREGVPVFIFQQDDYFFYPPKTNERMRRKNIKHVGLGEVNLRLLDEHVAHFKQYSAKPLKKPLIIFDEDRVRDEIIDPKAFGLGIVEGTYTTLLSQAARHVFIETDFKDTLQHREDRNRDTLDDFLEKVLEIEHNIISRHKSLADLIVGKDYNVRVVDPKKV